MAMELQVRGGAFPEMGVLPKNVALSITWVSDRDAPCWYVGKRTRRHLMGAGLRRSRLSTLVADHRAGSSRTRLWIGLGFSRREQQLSLKKVSNQVQSGVLIGRYLPLAQHGPAHPTQAVLPIAYLVNPRLRQSSRGGRWYAAVPEVDSTLSDLAPLNITNFMIDRLYDMNII